MLQSEEVLEKIPEDALLHIFVASGGRDMNRSSHLQ
jgi:hypothetical protein